MTKLHSYPGMKFSVSFTWRRWGSEGGWPARGQRLGLTSRLLGFLLTQLIRSQSPGKPLKCGKREGAAKSDLHLGFRRQDLIWAGGANCFHMKANSEHEHGRSCGRQSFCRARPLPLSLIGSPSVCLHPWRVSCSGPAAHGQPGLNFRCLAAFYSHLPTQANV